MSQNVHHVKLVLLNFELYFQKSYVHSFGGFIIVGVA